MIVFFDGVCNLCNRWVDLLIRIDRRERLRFASLQSPAAARLPDAVRAQDSIAVETDDGRHLVRSDAVLAIAREVGGVLVPLRIGSLLPRSIRDAVYRFVARNRFRWFGKRDTCRLPTAAERARFLDDGA